MNDLVQTIGSAHKKPVKQREVRLTVNQYFFLAALTGFFGVLYLGLHLLLIRDGVMRPWRYYDSLRGLHAFLQVYLFLAIFIVGFLLQAAPTLFSIRKELSHHGSKFLLLLYISAAIKFFGSSWVYNLPLAATFFLILVVISNFLRSATKEVLFSLGVPFLISLTSFGIGALLDIGDPYQALFVIWGGVGGAIFGAGQQFIATVLGGSRLRIATAIICWLQFIVSLVSLLCVTVYSIPECWQIFAYCSITTLLTYGYGTGLYGLFFKPRREILYHGSIFASFWALVGALLTLDGGGRVDSVVHIWTIGWATSVIIVIVPRIIGFLWARDPIPKTVLFTVLYLWQLVPVGRGFDWIVGKEGVIAASVALTISFGIWISCVLYACAHLFFNDRALRREVMATRS